MATALPLHSDFTADLLRRHARQTRDANQARRLLSLACIYGRNEGVGGSIVARGDAAPILELCENVFDALALAVELGVVVQRDLSVLAPWDAGHDALRMKGLAIPVTVIAARLPRASRALSG